MWIDRRTFLKSSLALAGQSAVLPFRAGADPTPVWEGIYTDRFTYRSGVDPILVHASLLEHTQVEVTLKRLQGPTDAVVATYTVAVDSTQTPEYPDVPTGGAGVHGPAFPERLAIDTSGMEPGLYEVWIDPNALRPENRQSYSTLTCLPSLHHLSHFVITAATRGSYSNILWLHDSVTGAAYGGFGGESIYGGCGTAAVRTVSLLRPGLDRGTSGLNHQHWQLHQDGYRFEYVDAVEFSLQPPSFTQNYDLILVCGQFEYPRHQFLANLEAHVDAGRNLLVCSNELGCFRSRRSQLAPSGSQMTTYKFDAPLQDPVVGVTRAGVGMHTAETIWETEITGFTVWSAHNMGTASRRDMTITNVEQTGWLFEGTGFDGVIPQFLSDFAGGNRGVLRTGARFDLLDPGQSRTDPNTIAWAVAPSSDARKWWEAPPGADVSSWPIDPDGHAICTWRETASGARIIALPSQYMLAYRILPGYHRLFDNIFAYLTEPKSVPALGPVAGGALATGIAGSAARALRRALNRNPTADERLPNRPVAGLR